MKMAEQLFRLSKDGTGTLQKQIQEMLVKAILDGHIPIDQALPSGRKLAEQLNVARNTLKESSDIFMGMEDISTSGEQQYETWRLCLEDMERKLLYVDRSLFGGR